MPTKTWYTLVLKAVPTRYGLSKNVQTLLQTLDWVHDGSVDSTELGRLVRMSPQRRASIANTITKCAGIIKKQPDELKTCVDIIEMCTEILEIADRPPPTDGFPFMKLPMGIRHMILALMIEQETFTNSTLPIIQTDRCNCPRLEREPFSVRRLKLPVTFGPALHDEFFQIFYRKKRIRFRCSCEMYDHLCQNQRLTKDLQNVAVHWCGPQSDKAFEMLAKCERLEKLTITISKSTLVCLNERADFMKAFFPIPLRSIRLSDVLGMDELLELRGLSEVMVHHVSAGKGSLAPETDRANLADLLRSMLKLPKEDGLSLANQLFP